MAKRKSKPQKVGKVAEKVKNGMENSAMLSTIAEDVWQINKNKLIKILSIIGSVWTIFFGIGIWRIYETAIEKATNKTAIIAVELAEEKITELIDTQFNKDNMKETFNLMAEKQAKKIVNKRLEPSFQKYKLNIDSKVRELNDYLDSTVKSLSNSSEEITKKLDSVKVLAEINLLADYAIAHGHASAFEKLEDISKQKNFDAKVRSAAMAKIMHIKNYYSSNNRIIGTNIFSVASNGERKANEEIPTFVLVREMLDGPYWEGRAKAAILLGGRKNKGIAEVLLQATARDSNLVGRKAALVSFSSITGFKPSDVFGFKSAYRWWNNNQTSFNENLISYDDEVIKKDEQATEHMKEGKWLSALLILDKANELDETCLFDSKSKRELKMIECRMQTGTFDHKDKNRIQELTEHFYPCISNYAKYLLAAFYDYEKQFVDSLSMVRETIESIGSCWFWVFYSWNERFFYNINKSIFSSNFQELINYTETKDKITMAMYDQAISKLISGEKNYAFLVFFAKWCVDCLYMNELIEDPIIKKMILNKFAYVPVDLGNNKNIYLKNKFEADYTTTVVILNKNEEVILKKKFAPISDAPNTSGPMNKDKMIEFINAF